MSFTDFPHGVTSFGIPVTGNGMLPLMGGNISATGEQKIYFVDPANASDDGGDGLSPSSALNTVSAAYAKTRDKSGDTVYLLNDGNTSGTAREDATITWSNDNCHLVGLCAPTVNQRARISPSAATTAVTPQLTVSGNGNIFHNISFVESNTTAADSTCISVTGLRNYFSYISMLNMLGSGGDDAATRAGSECLLLTGAEENTFHHCYIGADTTARSAANANVRFDAAAARNLFEDCTFAMRATAATPLFLDAPGANDLDRWTIFKDCLFVNAVSSSGTELTTAAVNISTSNGMFVFQNSVVVGAAEWESGSAGNCYTAMPTNTVTNTTAGGVADVITS